MTDAIDISPAERKELLALLKRYIPGVVVWAFGSRVQWTARPDSDLDLVVFSKPAQQALVSALKEALEESSLPFRVDVLVWDELPESFRQNILTHYIVLVEDNHQGIGVLQKWPALPLGELTHNHDGKRRPVKESDRSHGPYPYYGASGIVDYIDGYIFDGDYLLIAEDGENLRTRQTPIAFMAKGQFWVNNHAHIVTGNEKAETRYLLYALRGTDIQPFLTGAVMPKLTQGNLNRIPIPCPAPKIQRAIAHILGTLDDKIEVNRRLNQTLEQMAQAIFKAWFVDFEPVKAKIVAKQEGRDPLRAAMAAISGKRDVELDQLPHEHFDQLAAIAALFPDELVDSELSEIPKGWKVSSVSDEFDLTMGQSPPGRTYNDSGQGVPFYQGRTDFGFRFPTRRVYCTEPTRFAKTGDTLVSVRAPVGDINMASEGCAIGRGIAAVRHTTGCRSYSYQFMKSIKDMFERFNAECTVFGSIGKNDFHSIPCVKPPRDIIIKYEACVSSLDNYIETNERKLCTLATLRDTLFPKLLSGELAVPTGEQANSISC